ncbi:unnamed protein product [Pedinophyceae sp. YPF-701]|nr:unnamed protein product [Pedinophyceae sp. YPF-701]
MADSISSSTVAADDRARRVRELLSGFYGTAGGPPSSFRREREARESDYSDFDAPDASLPSSLRISRAATASRAPSSAATGGLDSHVFDADRYVSSVLRSLRLSDLLKHHSNISHEQRELDSALQALVYENYSKFIDATDTIKTMVDSLGGMQSNLEGLQDSMASIRDLSQSVDSKVHASRTDLEELNRIKSMMARLQALLGLPARMRAALDAADPAAAARLYVSALPTLTAFGHQGAMRAARAECRALEPEIGAALRARILQGGEAASESIELLEAMGHEAESLAGHYLAALDERACALLAAGAALLADCGAVAAAAEELAPWEGVAERIPRPEELLALLRHAAHAFGRMFPGHRSSLHGAVHARVAQAGELLRAALAGVTPSGPLSREVVLGRGLKSPRDVAAEVGTEVFWTQASGEVAWRASEVAHALQAVVCDLREVEAAVPSCGAGEEAAAVVSATLRHATAQYLALPCDSAVALLWSVVVADGPAAAHDAVQAALNVYSYGTAAAVSALRGLHDTVSPLVDAGERSALEGLARDAASYGLQSLLELLLHTTQRACAARTGAAWPGWPEDAPPPVLPESAAFRPLGAASERAGSEAVPFGCSDLREPARALMRLLAAAGSEAGAVLAQRGSTQRSNAPVVDPVSALAASRGRDIEREVERMFQEAGGGASAPLEATRSSVVCHVSLAGLKGAERGFKDADGPRGEWAAAALQVDLACIARVALGAAGGSAQASALGSALDDAAAAGLEAAVGRGGTPRLLRKDAVAAAVAETEAAGTRV